MKSKDLQKLLLSKYEKGEGPSEIFRHLNGALCLRTVKRWCKMIREAGSIELPTSPGRSPIIRTKESFKKVKHRLNRKKKVTSRKLAVELNISRTSVRRILKNELLLRPYKIIVELLLTDEHKEKRKKFSNWVRRRFRKEDTMKILFSDEKLFDIDGIYNSQNDRIWAVSRVEADKRAGVKQKQKFPEKVMIWLAVCSKGVSTIGIFDQGTIDRSCPIHPRSASSGSQIRKRHPGNLLDISTRWRNTWCPSSNATMVQRQLSIIHRQGSLASKQSRLKSSRLLNLGWTCSCC